MNTSTVPSVCPQCGYDSIQHDTVPVTPSDSARIDHLLHTNDYPTQQEETAFRSFVADGESFLPRLDTRIASVRALLLQLEATRKSLASAISSYEQPLNPIRRLPSDILQHIFFYGVGHDKPFERDFPTSPHSLDLRYPPWTYGRVCHQWKSVVCEMPSLWTRVNLPLDKFPKSLAKQMPLAQTLLSIYLCRSKGLPLTVFIRIPNSFSMASAAGFFDLVFSHSWRWTSLFLGSGKGLSEIKAISEDSFPSLEEIHTWNLIGSNGTVVVIPNIQASKLRVWTSNGNIPSASTTFPSSMRMMLPTAICTQITEYNISKIMTRDVIQVIRLLPHLRVLNVGRLSYESSPGTSLAAAHLPRVVQLCIDRDSLSGKSSSSVTAIEALLDSLSCPALAHLSLFVDGKISRSFKRFEERSNLALQHFIGGEHAATFVAGLRNCLALESIGVEGANSYQSIHDVLALLYAPSTSTTLTSDIQSLTKPTARFPKLRRLQFHLSAIPFVDAFMETAYANMGVRMFYTDLVVPLDLVITTPT
ncbi:hypothetical protein C8R42DRAFT_673067 [Lentinula raphanica]|nr:hypothetical protein C8R42DRAFT_673067 [Lentinula raphanica]